MELISVACAGDTPCDNADASKREAARALSVSNGCMIDFTFIKILVVLLSLDVNRWISNVCLREACAARLLGDFSAWARSAAQLRATQANITPKAVLIGQFTSSVAKGLTVIQTSEADGSVQCAIPDGLWPAEVMAMAGRGKLLPLYRFSSNGMKDLLFEYLTGTFQGWTVARDTGRDFFKQVSAEHRVEERDPRGHIRSQWNQKHEGNHYLDCELQVLMVGLVTKLVGQPIARR